MRTMVCIRLFLVLAAAAGASACGNDRTAPLPELPPEYADFPEFYQRFHADSAFQLAHIQFPLMGKSDTSAWQAEAWTLHRPVDYDRSDFTREFTPVGEDILVEYIIHRMGDYGMVRRWARLGNDWSLIYYAERNRAAPPARDSGGLQIEGGFGE